MWSFAALTCLMLTMLVTSCKQNASFLQEDLQEKTSFSALQQEISSFDVQFQRQNASQFRGWWSDFFDAVKKFFSDCGSVVVADVAGLAENTTVSVSPKPNGATVTIAINVGKAVSASISTAKEVFSKETEQKETKWVKWQSKPSYSMEYTGSVVGEAHNEIIKNLCELYKDKDLKEVSDEQMYQDVLKLTIKYFQLSPNDINKNTWKSFQQSADKICSEVAHKTPEEAIAYLRVYPRGDKKELNIIADYLVKIKSLPTEELRKMYAKGFSQIVGDSNISKQSKQRIINATATGINSIALWEQK